MTTNFSTGKTTYQERTEENKGDEVDIRKWAATFAVCQLTVCIRCTRQHNELPVFTSCGPTKQVTQGA